MAKAMAFQDQFGNSYESSYWRVVQINIGVADKHAHIVFYGYRDQAARAANKNSIGQKTYTVSGAEFDTLYAAHIAPGGPNLFQLAYQVATTTKDVIVDPNDPSQNVSFFENGVDV